MINVSFADLWIRVVILHGGDAWTVLPGGKGIPCNCRYGWHPLLFLLLCGVFYGWGFVCYILYARDEGKEFGRDREADV